MNLFYFALVCLATFISLHYYWIPKAEKKFTSNKGVAALGQSALINTLSVIKSTALIAVVTSCGIMLFFLIIENTGGATSDEIVSAINTTEAWQEQINNFSVGWGIAAVILLMMALIIHSRWKGKIKLQKVFARLYEGEYNRVKDLWDNDKLQPLPPTPEIEKIQGEVHNTRELLANIDNVKIPQGTTREKLKSDNETYLSTLYGLWRELEIRRRIDVNLDEDTVELPKPFTYWEKFQVFLFSKGLVKNINRGSRLVYLVAIALLVPSLISVYSTSIGNTIGERLVELRDLQVDLDVSNVQADLESKIEQLGEEKEEELSEEDLQVIDATADALEETIAEAYIAGTAIHASTRYTIRSRLVQDKVLARFASRSPSNIEKLPSGARASNLSSAEAELLNASEEALDGKKVRIDKDDVVRTNLKKAARRKPDL